MITFGDTDASVVAPFDVHAISQGKYVIFKISEKKAKP